MADFRAGTYRFDHVFPRSFSSEFPHDNPALSTGVVWACDSPCSPASPRREPEAPTPGVLVFGPEGAVSESEAWGVRLTRARPPRAAKPRAPEPVFEAAPEPAAETTPEPTPKPEPPDPFARLVTALSNVALHAGATKVAAALPEMLASSRSPLLDGAPLDAPTRELLAVGAAWRDVLSGASSDLGPCGARMLDEWGAELLARLLGRSQSATQELRRKLRDQGIAAFGFRDAA